jgi:predicted nucleic acid-binding protein
MRFLDTNILLYAASTAPEEERKAHIALDLLDSEDLALSVQVLQEFYVQATCAGRSAGLSHRQAMLLIEAFLRFPVQETTMSVMKASMDAKERFRISYWDAAIIEAARAIGCKTVLSENLSAGRDYDGVRVENPFEDRAESP